MKRSLLILVLSLVVASCKKDDSNPSQAIDQQEQVTAYFPMAVGNYWVYQISNADSTQVFTPSTEVDSVYIDKDSVCHGSVFKKITSSQWGVTLVRDSAGYLVDEAGLKLFTTLSVTSPLSQHYLEAPYQYFLTKVMRSADSLSVVPAGQFQAKYVIGTLTDAAATSPSMASRRIFTAYVKGIGIVAKRNTWVWSGGYIEEKLLRYKVNN